MFDKLKKKWKVSGVQLLLVLCTFAVGGSLDGYISRRIMTLFPLEKGVLWYVVYIVILTLLWPVCVLLVSVFFGQFRFFKNYLLRVARRMKLIK
jgi:hypothetical protein